VKVNHPHARRARGQVATLAVWVVLVLLAGAFFRIQVLRSDTYALTAESNRLRPLDLPPPRGRILDRHGRIIADNVPGYGVTLLPGPIDSTLAALDRLAPLLSLDSMRHAALRARARAAPTQPLPVLTDASHEAVAVLEERRSEFPAVFIEARPKRRYVGGAAVGHVVGYIGEITADELGSEFYAADHYEQGTIVGKTGIERQYERLLQGRKGVRYVEVDARLRIVGDFAGISTRPAAPGEDLQLGLDLELQEWIHRIFPDSLMGAVVALDPEDGSVLALYSAPSYDPNLFVGGIDRVSWAALNTDEHQPLYNKAVLGRFAPASTWKLASAAIALDLGLVRPDERMSVPCRGSYAYGGRVWRCWKPDGHGDVTLLEAIQHSCNVYFYQLGLRIGLQRLLEEATGLGFSQTCGIDLPQEEPGIFPRGPEFWERTLGYTPRESEVLSLIIGQGPNQQTPLKMAQFYAAIARDGSAPAPRLAVEGSGAGAPDWALNLTREALATMREGLRRVTAPGGTAYLSSLEHWDLYGKTGTGQNPLSAQGLAADDAWFAGMAGPRGGDPEIVVVVLVQYGGGGSSVAAPLMAKTADFYLRRKYGIPIDTIQTLGEHLRTRGWPSWATVRP
jgi:penicillin-binding protein 2